MVVVAPTRARGSRPVVLRTLHTRPERFMGPEIVEFARLGAGEVPSSLSVWLRLRLDWLRDMMMFERDMYSIYLSTGIVSHVQIE
jgi:hypothetical protein